MLDVNLLKPKTISILKAAIAACKEDNFSVFSDREMHDHGIIKMSLWGQIDYMLAIKMLGEPEVKDRLRSGYFSPSGNFPFYSDVSLLNQYGCVKRTVQKELKIPLNIIKLIDGAKNLDETVEAVSSVLTSNLGYFFTKAGRISFLQKVMNQVNLRPSLISAVKGVRLISEGEFRFGGFGPLLDYHLASPNAIAKTRLVYNLGEDFDSCFIPSDKYIGQVFTSTKSMVDPSISIQQCIETAFDLNPQEYGIIGDRTCDKEDLWKLLLRSVP